MDTRAEMKLYFLREFIYVVVISNVGDMLFIWTDVFKINETIANRMVLLLYHNHAWGNARTNLNTV